MNTTAKTIVSGTFKSEKILSEAFQYLDSIGVPKEDINIIVSDKSIGKDFKINTSNKVPEIALKGLTTGTITGGILGSLSFVGILIIPMIGIAIAGPVIGAMAGIVAGGIIGSLIGAVIGITIPEYEAIFFYDNSEKNILLITRIDKVIKNVVKKKFKKIGAKNIAAQ